MTMTMCPDCMGSRKKHGRIGGKYHSCPRCLGLGKVRAQTPIYTCSWCLEKQIVEITPDTLENAGWELDEDERAYCPECLRWLNG